MHSVLDRRHERNESSMTKDLHRNLYSWCTVRVSEDMHNIHLPQLAWALINTDVENSADATEQSHGVEFVLLYTYMYALIRTLIITLHKATLLHPFIPLVCGFFFLRVYNNVDELECSLLDRVSSPCRNLTLLTIILFSTQIPPLFQNYTYIYIYIHIYISKNIIFL